MPTNTPGPYEIEFFYTSNGNQHVQRLNCDTVAGPTEGDPPDTIYLDVKSGGSGTRLDSAAANWATLMAGILNTSSTIDTYNLWRVAPGTYDRTFITGSALGTVGLSTDPEVPMHQVTGTFRTLGGGIMKVVGLETIHGFNTRQAKASAPASLQAISDFVISDNNWLLARDTTWPIFALNWVGGQNEALFKKTHR